MFIICIYNIYRLVQLFMRGKCPGKPAKKKQKRLAETTEKLKDKEREEKDKRRENKDKDLRVQLYSSGLKLRGVTTSNAHYT